MRGNAVVGSVFQGHSFRGLFVVYELEGHKLLKTMPGNRPLSQYTNKGSFYCVI